MSSKISIKIEKNESGYSAYSPEIEGYRTEGDSLDVVIDEIKEAIRLYLSKTDNKATNTANQSLLELFESITADMTEEEIKQLPSDGAEQHDHYIYGTPKKKQ